MFWPDRDSLNGFDDYNRKSDWMSSISRVTFHWNNTAFFSERFFWFCVMIINAWAEVKWILKYYFHCMILFERKKVLTWYNQTLMRFCGYNRLFKTIVWKIGSRGLNIGFLYLPGRDYNNAFPFKFSIFFNLESRTKEKSEKTKSVDFFKNRNMKCVIFLSDE